MKNLFKQLKDTVLTYLGYKPTTSNRKCKDPVTGFYTNVPNVFSERLERRQEVNKAKYSKFFFSYYNSDKTLEVVIVPEPDIKEVILIHNGIALVMVQHLNEVGYGLSCPIEMLHYQHHTLYDEMLEFLREELQLTKPVSILSVDSFYKGE